MLNFAASLKIHLHVAPMDMRKSFQGLTAIAKHEMEQNPADGSVFVFCNRSRTLVKLLYFDEPAKLSRHAIVRTKFRHVVDREISPIIAKAPPRFCSDHASISLAVHIAIGKYLEHGSLNRLQKLFARMVDGMQVDTQSTP